MGQRNSEGERAIMLLDGMTLDGDATAHRGDGSPILVEDGIPGEQVDVRITSAGRQARGEIVRIISTSPHRVVPPCRHFGPCGGCAWQHIAYDEQLRLKQRLCESLLRAALGSRSPRVEATIAATSAVDGAPWGYRSKVHFTCTEHNGVLTLGHFRRRSNAVLPVRECPVHAPAGNALAFAMADELRRAGVPAVTPDLRRGTLRHIVVRVAAATGERLVTVVVRRLDRRVSDALMRAVAQAGDAGTSVHVNLHDQDDPYLFGKTTKRVSGHNRLREEIGGLSFALSPTAFFQTNVAAAETLVQLVTAAVPTDSGSVLDLYAGAGLFALPLARRGHRVLAVEENADAVADGVEARRLNGIDAGRCRFVASRVEDAIRNPRLSVAPDAVILDPPRAGCDRRVLKHLASRMRPPLMIYVSCNPSALAADLAAVQPLGYAAERVQPVDMFPHTAHVEAVAVLRRA